MKKHKLFTAFLLLLFVFTLNSCQAIADIFKAGMGFGIFIVLVVIAVIILIIVKMGKNKGS